MRSNAHQNYLENEILTAEPLKLVVLLYQGALDAIAAARWQGESLNRPARSQSIRKALNIVSELNRSLDMAKGGEVSAQLAKLYGYIARRLQAANKDWSDAPLAESERLLSTLLEAWKEASDSAPRSEYAHVDFAW
jgi:flagellar protein FliS